MTAPMRTQERDHRKTEAGRCDKHAATGSHRQTLTGDLIHSLAGKYQARIQFKDHSALVNELRLMGRCVVVATGPACFPPTDGVMGDRISLIGDFATRDEADALANEDRDYQDAELQIEVLSPIHPQIE
jgi:hypothetical protein